jgi:saccharopine dehydrogenase-like NADP-dependent oxidoreductase
MRIWALGGCGQEGKPAVRDLIEQDDIVEVVVADLNADCARIRWYTWT